MEEGFYEIDVNTLKANTLYPDVNGGMHDDTDINPTNDLLPAHMVRGCIVDKEYWFSLTTEKQPTKHWRNLTYLQDVWRNGTEKTGK